MNRVIKEKKELNGKKYFNVRKITIKHDKKFTRRSTE